jgi:hypothetical protein
LTVTATYVQGHAKGQDVTMQGNSPGATGCEPTSNCNQLRATLLAVGTACPTSWPYESSPTPVVPSHQGNVAAGPFSQAFSIWADSHPQLNEPSKYHLCSYLVDATTAEYATLASADTPLGTPNVGTASVTLIAQGPATAADSGTISIDVGGTTSAPGMIVVQALDDGKQCGAKYTDNYNQQFGLATDDVPAGNIALHLDLTPTDPTTQMPRAGYYKLCAYLNQVSPNSPPEAYYVETPAATTSVDHVISSVGCPSSTFSIDDPQQQVAFWISGDGINAYGATGLATTHVTVPGPGSISVTPEDGSDNSGAGSRHYSKAGRYGVDINALPWTEEFKDLYRSQQSKTIQYVVTYTPDFVGASCVQSDMTTFVDKADLKGTRKTSVHWVPAKTQTQLCHELGCPVGVTAGCHTVEMTCYERTLTLKLTKKAWSGTVKETGGGSHCRGTGKKKAWVYLWQLKKRKWFQVTAVKATNGKYSGRFTAEGGTFQATIGYHDGTGSGSDYICGEGLSEPKKVPPG